MVVKGITESDVESAALAWLEALGWCIAHGPNILPDSDTLTLALSPKEGGIYSKVVLTQRLRGALVPKLISGQIRVKDAERFLEEGAVIL